MLAARGCFYVTQNGNWALIGNDSDSFAKVPTDPLTTLGDLPKRYDLAVRASIKNLPKAYRDQLLAQLRAGAEVGMQQTSSESEEEHAALLWAAELGKGAVVAMGLAKRVIELRHGMLPAFVFSAVHALPNDEAERAALLARLT